ncbi:MAG TPA: Rieske 2Fe-2S domain-containing protein [Myxococcota bacterium]|nr:Rieske 2Fe-2S domain-containing protein [Myxococcota bacterium]
MLRDAAALDELRIGEMKGVLLGGRPVLLVRLDDGVRAYADRCSHQGVRLSEGRLEGRVLTCHSHEWVYDAATGRGINPARCELVAYPAEVRAGRIYVDTEVQP